jgi:hypothetical protein
MTEINNSIIDFASSEYQGTVDEGFDRAKEILAEMGKEFTINEIHDAENNDLSFVLYSRKSESLNYNTLIVPILKAECVYNFYDAMETDVKSQEDPSKDPLLKSKPYNVPRYVDISWDVFSVTEPTYINFDTRKAKSDLFDSKNGTSSTKTGGTVNSHDKYAKNTNPLLVDGVKKELVDTHNPEKAFGAIANDLMFSNAIDLNIVPDEKVGSNIQISVQSVEQNKG